jgi:protein O-GlcNAc transferase
VAEPVVRMPGYTRGLAFSGQFAFVGLSRIREAHIFGGLPVQTEFDQLNCGIGVVDLVSGKNVAAFQFHSGVEEIFDVQLLPGIQNPFLLGPSPSESDEQEVWVVPPPAQSPVIAASPAKPHFYRRGSAATSGHSGTQDPRELVQAGLKLQEQGRLHEAMAVFQTASALDPLYTDPIINLGNVYQELNKHEEAIACYREAIRINPASVNAFRNLGYLLKEQGLHDEGLKQLRHAQELEPNPIIEFVLKTNLPPIYSSLEDLQERRRQLETDVQQLCDSGFRIDAATSAAPTNFYAAYQGLNDRHLQRQLASLIEVPQPVLKRAPRSQGQRLRIGFISRHYRNHTIGRLNLGIIRNLPRELFEVVVISVGAHQDQMAQAFAQAADQYVTLPTNLAAIRSAVVELGLDVLYYSDVGMDTLTYTLSLSRLAPVQCATWGHPETTGSPVMDYFISSQTLEVPEADQHYSEQLERFEVLNVFYYRPELPPVRDHASFGLDPQDSNYLCFQNLFKIHPDFDQILAGILQRDPRAAIIMMEPRYPAWGASLRKRWETSIGPRAERIRFLPTLPHADFLSLNALADVSLDPLHFGGGNTTYEALAVGLPVVTLPSAFLRARISQALYRQMDYLDLIVDSPEAYVDLAVRLGTDRDLRRATSEKILHRCGRLFEDQLAIDEYSRFFQSLGASLPRADAENGVRSSFR